MADERHGLPPSRPKYGSARSCGRGVRDDRRLARGRRQRLVACSSRSGTAWCLAVTPGFQLGRGHVAEAPRQAACLPAVSVVIGLEPVPFALHVGGLRQVVVPLRLERTEPIGALMAFRRGDEEARHELRLVLGEAPDAAIGLDEPDGEEVVELGMEDIEIEPKPPVSVEDQIVVDEREGPSRNPWRRRGDRPRPLSRRQSGPCGP